MYLSTTTSLVYMDYKNDPIGCYTKIFKQLKAAGFDRADVFLWSICDPDGWIMSDGYAEIVSAIKAAADAQGLGLHQTHGNTHGGKEWDDPNYPLHEFKRISNLRCLAVTKLLGAEWMVLHPMNLPHDPLYSAKRAKEANLRYLDPFINEAIKLGVGIAVENMVDFKGHRRRYCGGDIYELIELVDTIGDPHVGICLDTGHANIGGIDCPEAIREIGSRLKCTHINDNFAEGDDHLFPHFGNMNWEPIGAALREIGYDGDFAYEAGLKNITPDLYDSYFKYIADLGRSIMNG